MNSKIDNLITAFKRRESLTAKQISARFRIANPTAAVNDIREKGYAIYLNESTNSKGRVVRRYQLGHPTREIIAAGYAVLGAEAAGLC